MKFGVIHFSFLWIKKLRSACYSFLGFPFLSLWVLMMAGCASNKTLITNNFGYNTFRIAIIPFESSNPYLPGNVFSDYFTVEIINSIPGLNVIERKDIKQIFKEQKLSMTGAARDERFSVLGSVLGVDAILFGTAQTLQTIQSIGGSISVTIKLMEVSTGKVIWADHQQISHSTWRSREVPEIADTLIIKAAGKMVKKMAYGVSPEMLTRHDILKEIQMSRETTFKAISLRSR